ncbi:MULTISPECIES: hypothetical protein [Photorhabdus]|uniref:Uncharacterized protein n=1 Tax=Photorhabdus aegyptia TaxID=2805098 RepID=A0A022PKU6_9GAMM|nr:hypothetical protein BA1DRAFT_01850 [Photorhabdus aegyptia]
MKPISLIELKELMLNDAESIAAYKEADKGLKKSSWRKYEDLGTLCGSVWRGY